MRIGLASRAGASIRSARTKHWGASLRSRTKACPQSFVLTKRIDAPALVFSQFTAYPLQTQNKNSDVGYKQFAFLGPVKQIESNPIISNKR